MAEITAKMVADLRAATGLGMMECKKALVEAEGNFDKAEEILRIKSGAKAGKLAGRTAAEGVLAYAINGNVGALVEVNCETDFVAKDAGFVEFANFVAKTAAEKKPATVEELSELVEAERKAIIAKIGREHVCSPLPSDRHCQPTGCLHPRRTDMFSPNLAMMALRSASTSSLSSSTVAGFFSAAVFATKLANSTKPASLATKSVSQFTSTNAPTLPLMA